jgi:hypothetical protein
MFCGADLGVEGGVDLGVDMGVDLRQDFMARKTWYTRHDGNGQSRQVYPQKSAPHPPKPTTWCHERDSRHSSRAMGPEQGLQITCMKDEG